MKKYFLSLLCCACIAGASAQISIQPVIPFAGMIQKSNLWNITVINTSPATLECRLELVLRDRSTGLETLTATTGFFTAGTGAKQVNSSLLVPIQYNYISSSVTSRNDDLIPIGNYTACYRLTAGKNIVAEECVSFDVEPLSPPMLINPSDSSILAVSPSQFTWAPPSPMNLFNRLQYEVQVVEILPGQKAEEAMQQNLPFYSEPNVPVNNLSYTGAAVDFEKDKWYAWQVTARDDNNYAAKSEVWVFRMSEQPKPVAVVSGMYAEINNSVRAAYTVDGGTLHVKYISDEPEFETEVIFRDDKDVIIKTIKQKIKQGENYLDFTLGNQFKEKKSYKIIIADNQHKAHTLTFSINTK